MKLSEVKPLIYPVFREITTKILNIQIFLFGSILDELVSAMDIDVLVIYNKTSDTKVIDDMLSAVSFRLPIHVVYMTPKEEQELNFIETQNAINISDLDLI